MSLASQINALATRIGQEIKAIKANYLLSSGGTVSGGLTVSGDFFAAKPAFGGFPLAPNLIHNSYMNHVTGGVPDGYSVFSNPNITISSVSPFAQAFEGRYLPQTYFVANPSLFTNNPALADDNGIVTYWFGEYLKGSRMHRGGMGDGWHSFSDGHILKISGSGVTSGQHSSISLPKEENNVGAMWIFSCFVKIIKGSNFAVGSDAGYGLGAPNSITKAICDTGSEGWTRHVVLMNTSQITSIDGLAISMAINPDGNGDILGYVALPYLANVMYKGSEMDSWSGSVLDKLDRQGIYIHPTTKDVLFSSSNLFSGANKIILEGDSRLTNARPANGGNAATLGGLSPSGSNSGNTVVTRDANGYIYGSYINSNRGLENSAAESYIYDTGDGYMRKKSLANIRAEIVIASDVLAKIKTVDGAGSGLDADLLSGLSKSKLWNNSGQDHGAYNNFNDIPDFGVWFVHQDGVITDGPGVTGQFYTMTQGLGNGYDYSQYVMMTAILRGSGNYFWVRFREGGGWGAWVKMGAGYADTAGSAPTSDLAVTYAKVANNLKTSAAVSSTVDLSANGIGKVTLSANTAFTFTGFELNKSYLLIITANGYTPSFAVGAKHVPVVGNMAFDTSSVFYVNLTCIDATSGSEKLLTTVMKGA